jgi:hypothetical protein
MPSPLSDIAAASTTKPILMLFRIAFLPMRFLTPVHPREKYATQTNAAHQGTVMSEVNQWRSAA